MFKGNWDDLGVRIGFPRQSEFISTQFHRALRDLQTSPDITTVHGDFPCDELKALLIDNVCDFLQSLLQNDLNLLQRVGFVDQTIVTDTRADFRLHALWQVHRVGDGNDEQA